jgi:hypothetical protein
VTDAPTPAERVTQCGCGTWYTQTAIPAPLAAEALRRGALASLEYAIPGGWTPPQCPRCERRALQTEHDTGQRSFPEPREVP